MNKKVLAGLVATALLLVGGRYYRAQSGSQPVPPPPPAAASAITALAPAVPGPPAPTIRHPLPAASTVAPAPGGVSVLQSLRNGLGRRTLALLFDDERIVRIVKTVDHLPRRKLQADAMSLRLIRANGVLEFADADLAARSAVQKIMLRLGTQNAAAVKTKLRELRQELTRGAAG